MLECSKLPAVHVQPAGQHHARHSLGGGSARVHLEKVCFRHIQRHVYYTIRGTLFPYFHCACNANTHHDQA